MKIITPRLLEESYDYDSYRKLLDELLANNMTTGSNQSESMLNYARLNNKRMSKWQKIGKLSPELVEKLEEIQSPMTWLVVTEGWCGDAAQVLPFIQKMVELNQNIDLKLILRDEYPEVIDQFLTNGGRSIPKLIALDGQLNVLGNWGPRPAPIQKEFLENKITLQRTGKEFTEYMYLWYAKDRGVTTQKEFLAMLDVWNQKLQSSLEPAG